MRPLQSAALKTLAYADIFDYPLTQTEVHRWLIGLQAPRASIFKALKSFPQTSSYYHLPHRRSIVKLRRQRQRFSQSKLAKAQQIAKLLKLIPTIKLLALTGALTMNNSDQNDDLDLMVITQTNRLWLTRFLAILLLDLLRLRRHPHQKQFQDKFCLNLFLDESALTIHPSRRNLYTAHEICQIQPLFDRQNTYQKFITLNSWIKTYLPQALPPLKPLYPSLPKTQPFFLETLAFKLQHLYMKPKVTIEKVSLHSAFFHPRPTSQIILNQYQAKLKELKLK